MTPLHVLSGSLLLSALPRFFAVLSRFCALFTGEISLQEPRPDSLQGFNFTFARACCLGE